MPGMVLQRDTCVSTMGHISREWNGVKSLPREKVESQKHKSEFGISVVGIASPRGAWCRIKVQTDITIL